MDTKESKTAEALQNLSHILDRAKQVHLDFSRYVHSEIKVQGKSMDEWYEHFSIEISDSPTLQECKELDIKLMRFHEEATFLKCMSEAINSLGRKSYNTQYREKFTNLCAAYKKDDKKLPAKDTLEILASQDLEEIDTGLIFSEVSVKFWKDIIEDLNFKRKSIENITILNATEAKANAASNGLQNKKD